MSRFPNPTIVPSESTVEQIANHQILCLLSPYGSWFYVPTKNEEFHLGYDASLQNHKALVIQYKRLKLSSRSAFVSLTEHQHSKLRTIFPPSTRPYVFYGFALHQCYADIDAEFSAGLGNLFGARMIFIDAHAVPPDAKRISIRLVPNLRLTARKVPLQFRNLFDIVRQFQACNLGLYSELLLEPPFNRIDATHGKALPNLNLMWARAR